MPLIVNHRPIDDSILDAEFAQVKAYHERTSNVSCCERDPEFRQTARDNVVGRVLLTEEALRTVPAPDDAELDAALEKLKQEHGGEPQLCAALGIAAEQIPLVRDDLAIRIRVDRLLDRLVENDPEPTDEQLRAHYQANLAAFTDPEQRRASHISKGVSRMASRDGMLEEFRAVREALLDGADFAELARKHSDRGEDLVDLGLFRQGDLPEEVELVAFTMRPGEISPVFSSSVGVHIVKLTEIHPPAARPFDESRDEARRMLIEQRKRDRAQDLIDKLKATAIIEQIDPDLTTEEGELPAAV
jgi:parvulin-like peptidyl-prolyl isomerase